MGVFRIKEDVESLLEKDPYELFTIDEPHRVARRLRPEFWGAAFVGVLVAFGVAFLTFWRVQQDGRQGGDQPFAYFEIRALDPDGRPVAGALVRAGDQALGVTDSFGEWRRFMRVKPGSTVALHLAKKIGGSTLAAVKNIAVPPTLPASGDLELTGSVQLTPGGKPLLVSRRQGGAAATATAGHPASVAPSRLATNDETSDDVAAAVIGAAGAAASPGVRTGEALASPPSSASSGAPALAPSAASSAAVSAASPAASSAAPASSQSPSLTAGDDPFNTVAFAVEGKATSALGEVLLALRQRSQELGLSEGSASPWRMVLTDVPIGPKPGGGGEVHLIRVDGFVTQAGRSTRIFSYLRNYDQAALQTARDILWSATVHVAKPHQVIRRDGVWYLEDGGPKLWALTPGRVVYDSGGLAYTVTAATGRLRLGAADTEPCTAGTRCVVTTSGSQRQAPMPGWQRLKLRVSGGDAGVLVYVTGYEARKLQDKIYEYWGAPTGGAVVTAVRGGRLVFRGRIQAGGGTLPAVALPSAALSRR